MSHADIVEHYFSWCLELDSNVRQVSSIRLKPIYGGTFGNGEFSTGTLLITTNEKHGFWHVVAHTSTGLVLVLGESKQQALSRFREFLKPELKMHFIARLATYEAQQKAEIERVSQEVESLRTGEGKSHKSKIRSIPRRRRQIFDEAGGRCHYCSTELVLDGVWHIDHKMPKALGGSNERTNLVASCAPCNTAKRDTTDIEFKEKLQRKTA